MKKPYQYLMNHRYRLVYRMPDFKQWTMWTSWHVCQPSTMPDEVQRNASYLEERVPGAVQRMEWLNPATGTWQDISNTSKYALFSD
jgi:hypothetical protein